MNNSHELTPNLQPSKCPCGKKDKNDTFVTAPDGTTEAICTHCYLDFIVENVRVMEHTRAIEAYKDKEHD